MEYPATECSSNGLVNSPFNFFNQRLGVYNKDAGDRHIFWEMKLVTAITFNCFITKHRKCVVVMNTVLKSRKGSIKWLFNSNFIRHFQFCTLCAGIRIMNQILWIQQYLLFISTLLLLEVHYNCAVTTLWLTASYIWMSSWPYWLRVLRGVMWNTRCVFDDN